jgi:hypothetical protein
MPFQSKNQMKAAFSGGLGKEMKKMASEWASATPDIKSLPRIKQREQKRANLRQYKSKKNN